MSVWPDTSSTSSPLRGSEGALISVFVTVNPRDLEDLLDALSQLNFPVNPQIFHDAEVRYVYADGRDEAEPTTIVEFPAYANRLPEIRKILDLNHFDADSLHCAGMLDEIHSDWHIEPAPPGARYQARQWIKHPRETVAAE